MEAVRAEMMEHCQTLQELFGDEASEELCKAINANPASFSNDPRPVVSNLAKAVIKFQSMQVYFCLFLVCGGC